MVAPHGSDVDSSVCDELSCRSRLNALDRQQQERARREADAMADLMHTIPTRVERGLQTRFGSAVQTLASLTFLLAPPLLGQGSPQA